MAPVYRKLHLNDLAQVDEITRSSSFGSSWSQAALIEEIQQGMSLGSFEGSQLISFVLYRQGPDSAEIMWLGTHVQFQKQGQMKSLLRQLFYVLRQGSELWLEVRQDNQAAAQLYRSLGFEQVGVRSRYYSTGHDAHLYSKKL